MDKKDNEQIASPTTAESTLESNQQRIDSTGDDGSLFIGRYF